MGMTLEQVSEILTGASLTVERTEIPGTWEEALYVTGSPMYIGTYVCIDAHDCIRIQTRVPLRRIR